MLRGAVFDMDGLMFDTEALTYKAWQKTMDKNGFEYNFDVYRQTVGGRTAETKRFYQSVYGSGFDYDFLRQQANVEFWGCIEKNGVPVKKGLVNLLEYLKSKGIKIALATSTSAQTAIPLLEKAGVKKYFDKFVCGDGVKHGKPHPEVFLTAARELALDPGDCVALEDSINGIKSACAAGMKPIMVPDLLEPTEEIKPMLFALCRDLDEVKEKIK